MKRILFITEYLDPPYDEGIKKTAHYLYRILNSNYNLQVICRYGPSDIGNVQCIGTNRLFLDRRLLAKCRTFHPDVLIYLPFASTTFTSYIRHFILSGYYRFKKKIMIALQPKNLKWWQKVLVKLISPDKVLTPSPQLQIQLEKLGIKNEIIPLYTDLNKFRAVESNIIRNKLRLKYLIAEDDFVVTHMGHLNEDRNLNNLIELQKKDYQILIVSSSSTPSDSKGTSSLKEELERIGIKIIDRYIESIEEVYQLSDLYIFPVQDLIGSIGLPLSVLEARACGIPVITTDYGSIKSSLANDNGGIFYSCPSEFLHTIELIEKESGRIYGKTKIKELNDGFINSIKRNIET